ncbi:MAG TPA: hypothetical protein VFX78_00105 [Candidatus Eisenbacteria bacterium]|nr:hypothetical protein [Candidatus Eisenbacteria bacterium]
MALLALLLFGAWLGSAVLHEHPGPPCQICKDLQASQADVVSALDPPRVDSPPERLADAAVVESPALLLAAPTGRGPPQG